MDGMNLYRYIEWDQYGICTGYTASPSQRQFGLTSPSDGKAWLMDFDDMFASKRLDMEVSGDRLLLMAQVKL